MVLQLFPVLWRGLTSTMSAHLRLWGLCVGLVIFLASPTAAAGQSEACASFSKQAPRIVIGCWQILERYNDDQEAVRTLAAYAEAGFTTFDTADIYGRSESVLGQLRETGIAPVIHTKYVTREAGEENARQVNLRSQQAIGGVPDLVAFHWWDYGDSRFVQVSLH